MTTRVALSSGARALGKGGGALCGAHTCWSAKTFIVAACLQGWMLIAVRALTCGKGSTVTVFAMWSALMSSCICRSSQPEGQ
jgi:hypothetical protein